MPMAIANERMANERMANERMEDGIKVYTVLVDGIHK
jgi:hypothetical protein